MRPIQKGSTDQSVVIRIIDSSDGTPETGVVYDTAGIDLWYRREGEVSVDITEATLAALSTAHTDGGFLHINDGYYRLDLPDAAVAAGAGENGVMIGGTVTGMIVIGTYIPLVDYDPYAVANLGLTNLNATISSRGTSTVTTAQVNAECDAAIETYRLDELMETALQSQPVEGSLFGDLTEDDDGDQRFSEDALEQTPSSSGGDATEAKQNTIIANLTTVDNEIAAMQGNVNSILEDTNELQTSQGDWATATGFSTHSAADVVDNFETQSQADPTGFHVNVIEIGGTAQTANDNGADINEILTDTGTTLDGKLDDILEDTGATLPTAAEVATAVWTAASTRTDDFGTLLEQLAEFHLNDLTIANGTGIATLRNKANSGDLATWQITDDDTTTTRTDVVWS